MAHPALRLAAARHALGLADADDLVAAAHAALDDGVYARGLGELVTIPGIDLADAGRWFAAALAELGVVAPSPAGAMRAVLVPHLRSLAEGTVDPEAAVPRLAAVLSADSDATSWHPDDFWALVPDELRHLLWHFPYPDDPGAGRRPLGETSRAGDRAVAVARRWCEADRLDPAWVTPTVLALADAIGSNVGFDRLPVLADALEEAGCPDPDVLDHCRAGGPHADWCWAVAGVTGGPYAERHLRVIDADHVRTNPGMYIGGTGPSGLHHMLFRLVAGSLAEAIAGHGFAIRATLHADGRVVVGDDGRGVTAGDDGPDFAGAFTAFRYARPAGPGRQWFDYSVANALSERLHAESRSGGHRHRAEYRHGEPAGDVRRVGPAGGSGLDVTFRPDPEIFGEVRVDVRTVAAHLQRAAFLNRGGRVDADRRGRRGGRAVPGRRRPRQLRPPAVR